MLWRRCRSREPPSATHAPPHSSPRAAATFSSPEPTRAAAIAIAIASSAHLSTLVFAPYPSLAPASWHSVLDDLLTLNEAHAALRHLLCPGGADAAHQPHQDEPGWAHLCKLLRMAREGGCDDEVVSENETEPTSIPPASPPLPKRKMGLNLQPKRTYTSYPPPSPKHRLSTLPLGATTNH